MSQELVISGQLTSLNQYIDKERNNRFSAASIKKKETEKVFWECKKQKIKKAESLVLVVFVFYHKTRQEDYDNREFTQKFIWDGLVLAGVIQNDSQQFTPPIRIFIHKYDRKNPRTIVHLVEEKDPRAKGLPDLLREWH